MSRSGFTLMELLIVVATLAILAVVAVPNYTRAVERGYWRSANEILLAIYSGEQVAKVGSATNTYPDGDGGAGCAAAWTCIYMDAPNTAQVTYAIAGGGAAFTATATRTSSGQTLTITETKAPGGTWAAP